MKKLLILVFSAFGVLGFQPIPAQAIQTSVTLMGVDEVSLRNLASAPEFTQLVKIETDSFTLYWSGDHAPENLASGSAAVTVVFVQRSQDELLALAQEYGHRAASMGLTDFKVDISPDGGRLSLIVSNFDPKRELAAAIQSSDLPVYTEIQYSDLRFVSLSGRWADSPPYFAGGIMKFTDSSMRIHHCSTGFNVKVNGVSKLLSAAHCDLTGNRAWLDGDGQTLTTGGSQVSLALALDSMLITPVGGGAARTFIGSNASTTSVSVRGQITNAINDSICASGANSGEHCSIIIQGYGLIQCDKLLCPAYFGRRPDDLVAVAEGDSGGPVYSYRNDGSVSARGIISAGGVTCTSYCPVRVSSALCFSELYFIPLDQILTEWNATLVTS